MTTAIAVALLGRLKWYHGAVSVFKAQSLLLRVPCLGDGSMSDLRLDAGTAGDIGAVAYFDRLLGPSGCIADPVSMDGYLSDWRGLLKGRALCVLRPATTDDVARAVAVCHGNGIAVVPQGGNTSLTGAAVPDESGRQVVLSTARLKRIRAVDPSDLSIVAEAGVTIAELQLAAAERGVLFPLSFAAEGSATLGGAIATNAGGTAAVRYGSARDLLLGLEVVLPDGRVWNGLRRLHKDNAGYSLRQIFAGSEGTLGLITAAVMKLVPMPARREVAFCTVRSEAVLGAFWAELRGVAANAIRAVEYISGAGLQMVLQETGLKSPVGAGDHYVLVELDATEADDTIRDRLEGFLAGALESGVVLDAAVAQNEQHCATFWRLREDLSEAMRRAGVNYKQDVAVPVSKVGELLSLARSAVSQRFPHLAFVPFGHLGDGNIHMNLVRAKAQGGQDLAAEEEAVAGAIYQIVESLGGTFSAEHGIGQLKVRHLEEARSEVELDLMRKLKRAFDPGNLMNPGKVLDMGRPLPATEVELQDGFWTNG